MACQTYFWTGRLSCPRRPACLSHACVSKPDVTNASDSPSGPCLPRTSVTGPKTGSATETPTSWETRPQKREHGTAMFSSGSFPPSPHSPFFFFFFFFFGCVYSFPFPSQKIKNHHEYDWYPQVVVLPKIRVSPALPCLWIIWSLARCKNTNTAAWTKTLEDGSVRA